MALEIERKFLVDGEGWRAGVRQVIPIRQGYAETARGVVRVRLAGDQAFLTLKTRQTDLVRDEFEYSIPPADAAAMLAVFCAPGLVEKTRHLVPGFGLTWEVDVFSGANEGLVVAELELADPGQAFERPPWLGAEVSHDPAYRNSNLARNPYRQWTRPRPT